MRITQICCFFLLCPLIQIWAQEQDSVVEKTKFAIYPAVGYAPETGYNIGAIAFLVFNKKKQNHSFHRPSSITPYVIYTSNKQVLLKSDFDIYFDNGLNVNLEARFFDYPDYYYGIGNDTDPDIRELYSDKFVRFQGKVMKPFNSKVFAGLLFDLQYNSIQQVPEGGLLETQQPIGLEGGFNMGIGPGLQYDTRNSVLYPTNGRLINAGITLFSKVFGSEYVYANYLIDYRQYFEFLGPKNVVAFQFRANLSSGEDIPFYKLNPMGGGGRLRGIEHKNLYRDRQSLYFQVEGRQELFWRFGGVIFAGVGQVFDGFGDMRADQIRFVYGLGGRFRAIKDEKLNIRLDLGFTDNGQHAFYLSVREAF